MKTCSKCKIQKPVYDFRKRSKATDGLQSECKVCAKIHYEKNKEKYIERAAIWSKANPDKMQECRQSWADANKERRSEKHREWYKANKDRHAGIGKAWREANPEKRTSYKRNRRSRVLDAEGRHTASDVLSILSMQCGLCANCKTKLLKSGANKYHVDHIMPLARGGSNWPSNLQCLCPTCNMRKHAKDPIDWAREQGRLI